MIRIGIDVGGTNTDAVVMDGAKVLAGVKAATTGDVMSGVVAALKAVLEAAKLEPGAIDVVMIGTTHFTNAVVQRRDLAQTAAVRLGLPATAVAAADGRLARRSEGRDRRSLLSRPRRPRVRRPRDFAARREGTARHRRRTSGPRASARSPSPPCSVPSIPSARRGRATFCKRRCRTCISRCRATSAASVCWSARTRRS